MTVDYETLRDALLKDDLITGIHREGTSREYFSTHCPFHDDNNPSLMVFKDAAVNADGSLHSGYWKCLSGCGIGGLDVLWRKREGWTRKEHGPTAGKTKWRTPYLPRETEDLWVVAETAYRILQRYPDLGWWLKDRGVESQIQACYLGFHDGWITIPVFDQRGDMETLILRSTPPAQRVSEVRFHSPPGARPTLFSPNWDLVQRSNELVVVFGMFDALSMGVINVPAVSPTSGNDSLRAEDLPRDRKYILVPDRPEHEFESAKRVASDLIALGGDVEIRDLEHFDEEVEDANDVLRFEGQEALEKLVAGVL